MLYYTCVRGGKLPHIQKRLMWRWFYSSEAAGPVIERAGVVDANMQRMHGGTAIRRCLVTPVASKTKLHSTGDANGYMHAVNTSMTIR